MDDQLRNLKQKVEFFCSNEGKDMVYGFMERFLKSAQTAIENDQTIRNLIHEMGKKGLEMRISMDLTPVAKGISSKRIIEPSLDLTLTKQDKEFLKMLDIKVD